MLNIQNPALFGNYHPAARSTWGGAGGDFEETNDNNLGTFVATAGRRRRRRFSSMAFWPGTQDAGGGGASLGDPAWHRETQAQVASTSQRTATTDATDSDVELERVL